MDRTIPKVIREPVALSEFLPENWTMVTQKKKKGKIGQPSPPPRSPVARSASDIRAARRARLNMLLGLGPGVDAARDAATVVGSLGLGEA